MISVYPCIHLHLLFAGEQGWRSGESTRLPPVWPEFKSWRRRHMLSLLLVLSLAPTGFSPGTPVFPSPYKPTLPNSNSIWNARTPFNEFLRTLKCSVGKQITIFFTSNLFDRPHLWKMGHRQGSSTRTKITYEFRTLLWVLALFCRR